MCARKIQNRLGFLICVTSFFYQYLPRFAFPPSSQFLPQLDLISNIIVWSGLKRKKNHLRGGHSAALFKQSFQILTSCNDSVTNKFGVGRKNARFGWRVSSSRSVPTSTQLQLHLAINTEPGERLLLLSAIKPRRQINDRLACANKALEGPENYWLFRIFTNMQENELSCRFLFVSNNKSGKAGGRITRSSFGTYRYEYKLIMILCTPIGYPEIL